MKNVNALIKQYGDESVKQMAGILSGTKLSSLITPIVNDDYVLTISMPEYGIFADRGRGPGKMPPEEPILEWMNSKGIDTKAVYAIRRKIGREGTEGYHFLKVLKDNMPEFMKRIGPEAAKDIAEYLNDVTFADYTE